MNEVEVSINNYWNNQISKNLHVYDMWAAKRISGTHKGINVHFIKHNNSPENAPGKASLPHYPVPPFANYSLYVRTHYNGYNIPLPEEAIVATFAHEIGHTLGLLHTHHPGRLLSLAFNEENGTISNGCYQESVSRTRENKWYAGCIWGTSGKKKCAINGDFLCDTAADPNQSKLVDSDCVYNHPGSGNFREDNWGVLWTPPTHNIMSYSHDDCLNEFSRGQISIMWMQMPHLKSSVHYELPTISIGTVCYGTTKTATITGIPSDASVSWEVKPANLVSVSMGTGTEANLSVASSTSKGAASIIYTLTGANNCYVARIKKNFWVGGPIMTGTVSGPETLTPGLRAVYSVERVAGNGISYRWTIPSGCYANYCWEIISGQGTTQIQIAAGDPGYDAIQCRVTNSCGADSRYMFVTVQGSGGGSGGGGSDPCGTTLSVSPNPHNRGKGGGVIIYVIEPPISCLSLVATSENQPRNILEIYNQQGELKFYGEYEEDEITLNNLDLDHGINLLFVQHNGELLTDRIVVN